MPPFSSFETRWAKEFDRPDRLPEWPSLFGALVQEYGNPCPGIFIYFEFSARCTVMNDPIELPNGLLEVVYLRLSICRGAFYSSAICPNAHATNILHQSLMLPATKLLPSMIITTGATPWLSTDEMFDERQNKRFEQG